MSKTARYKQIVWCQEEGTEQGGENSSKTSAKQVKIELAISYWKIGKVFAKKKIDTSH